jgi:antitoxin YefM
MNATKARQNLYSLIQQVNVNHEPVVITGKRGEAVLVGGDDWRAIRETLYLNGIPGMVDSIQKGMQTPIDELSPDVDW